MARWRASGGRGDGFKDGGCGWRNFPECRYSAPGPASSAGGSDAAKDDGDQEKAVPVGEHEVQRVVIRYNDGFEDTRRILGKQAYEFVIQTSGWRS